MRAILRKLSGWAMVLLGGACAGDETQVVEGALVVVPAGLDFRGVAAGAEASRTIEVRNTGGRSLALQATSPTDFFVDPPFLRLDARKATEVRITFRPTGDGAREGRITFRPVGAEAGAEIEVRGEGVGNPLDLPASLDFEEALVGTESVLRLPVGNRTDAPLRISIRLVAGDSFGLLEDVFLLEPGETQERPIAFSPRDVGVHFGAVEIRPCESCATQTVSLLGRGAERLLAVEPNRMDFGHVPPEAAKTLELRLINRGRAALSVRPPTVTEGGEWFSIVSEVESVELEPGAEAILAVRFSPEAEGDFEGRIRIGTPEERVLAEVPLEGRGGKPSVVVEPMEIDFGATVLRHGRRHSLQLRNLNDGIPASLVGLRFEGNGTRVFSALPPELPALLPADALEIEVLYLAEESGSHEGELVLSLDAPPGEIRIPLRGRTLTPGRCELVSEASELRFGLVPRDYSGVRSVGIRNDGGEGCVVWEVGVEGRDAPLFSVSPASGVFELAPGQSREIEVQAHFANEDVERKIASLVVRSGPLNDADVLEIPILVEAFWDSLAGRLDFEDTPTDRVSLRAIAGTVDMAFAPGSSPAFRLLTEDGLRDSCHGNCLFYGMVAFLPDVPGLHRAQLELRLDDHLPMLVDLEGRGVAPCGDCADWPQPHCGESMEVRVDSGPIELTDDWPHGCYWSVVASEPTYAGLPSPGRTPWVRLEKPTIDSCQGSLAFAGVAEATVGNLRVGPDGRGAYCEATMAAVAPEGLWIEAAPHDPVESYRMALMAGLDPTQRYSWFDGDAACWGPGPSPSVSCAWDGPSAEDDPEFSWSGFVGWTGSHGGLPLLRLHLPLPVPAKAYHFGFFAEPARRVAPSFSALRVRVFCDGALVSEIDRGINRGENRFRVHGNVVFSDPSTCSFTPDGLTSFPFYAVD